jgi:acyl-CoA synthetase (NDP forming)
MLRSFEQAHSIGETGELFALKIVSPDIPHKTEVGGIMLNVCGAEAVARAYETIIARVKKARPDAALDGVVASPMRGGGIEMFVGVARDPDWGLAMAVGFGGVFVELLADTSLRLLPATPSEAGEMMMQLKGARLLQGYRGEEPADLEQLAQIIARIGDAALALGPDLMALEINPLWVAGSRIECLDALAVWR